MPCAIVGVHCDRSSKMLSRVARLALMSILMLSASTSAMAVEPAAGTLVVVNAWSRATAPGAPVGVAYFDIVNSGGQDALLHIETPVAPQVEIAPQVRLVATPPVRPKTVPPLPTGIRRNACTPWKGCSRSSSA